MIIIKAHFNGTVIVPDEPVQLPTDQPLLIQVEIVQPPAAAHHDEHGERDLPSYLTLDEDRDL